MNFGRTAYLLLQGARVDAPLFNDMGKSSPPPPPDYTGAARAQGGANLQSTIASYILNNPTQITPYGTLSNRQTGSFTIPGAEGNSPVDVPTFTSSIDFTPEGKARFDQEQRIIGNLGGVAENVTGRVGESFAQPFSLGSADQAQSKAESAILSRLQPQLDRARSMRETQLANQGLAMDSEAYRNSMTDLGQQENDARMQAVLQGFNVRPQVIQEEAYLRNLPLNELNALRSGSQITNPQFQGPGSLSVQPAPVFQGAQAQGQAALQAYNTGAMQDAMLSQGLFSLGGAALGSPVGKSGKPWWLGG